MAQVRKAMAERDPMRVVFHSPRAVAEASCLFSSAIAYWKESEALFLLLDSSRLHMGPFMKATDPTLHAQMYHIAASARKATSANKAILIIEFYDEEKEKDCTMLMYDCRDPDGDKQEVVKVVIATLQAIQSMFDTTSDLQLTLKNKETGEAIEIDRHDAFMKEISL